MAKFYSLALFVSLTVFALMGTLLAAETDKLRLRNRQPALLNRQENASSDGDAETTVTPPGRTTTTIVTSTQSLPSSPSRTSTSRQTSASQSPSSRQTAVDSTTSVRSTQSPQAPPPPPPPSSTTQNADPVSTTNVPNPPADSVSSTTQMMSSSTTTRRVVTTVFSTITSGRDVGRVSTIVSTSTAIETPLVPVNPTGSAQGNSSSGEGIKTSTRNTIIGVVVGVGGALLIGGLAIFAWRLKKRRGTNPVDEDDLMRREGSPLAGGREMRTASPEESPFKATLDQYHKPPGTVNASSNF
jgi:hypothetical protein